MTYYQQCMLKTKSLFGDSLVFYIIKLYEMKKIAEQLKFIRNTMHLLEDYADKHSVTMPSELINKLEAIYNKIKQ